MLFCYIYTKRLILGVKNNVTGIKIGFNLRNFGKKIFTENLP